MSIFKNLFGSGKPVPSCEIHPNDKDLIRITDTIWWMNLTMGELKDFEKQDNAGRASLYLYIINDIGLTKDEAIQEVKKTFPFYYLTLAQRGDIGLLNEDEANLPYVLKHRINHLVTTKIFKESRNKGTHIHSHIRSLLKTD